MQCEQIEAAEIAEKYVTGRLGEDQRAEFEDHFLGCTRCFEQVQLWQDVQAAMPGRARRDYRWMALLAVAATLLVAWGAVWLQVRSVPRRTMARSTAPGALAGSARAALDVAALAAISPPHYSQPRWRAGGQSGFELAMRRYSRGDYAGAASALLEVRKADRDNSAAEFFLGISYLMQGRDDEGIAHLKATIALGDSPELEEAHLYLAKALLRKQDIAGATAEIRQAIARHGPRQAEEQALLRGIGEARPAR